MKMTKKGGEQYCQRVLASNESRIPTQRRRRNDLEAVMAGEKEADPNQPKSEVCGSRENEQQAFEKVARETIFSVEDQVSRQI